MNYPGWIIIRNTSQPAMLQERQHVAGEGVVVFCRGFQFVSFRKQDYLCLKYIIQKSKFVSILYSEVSYAITQESKALRLYNCIIKIQTIANSQALLASFPFSALLICIFNGSTFYNPFKGSTDYNHCNVFQVFVRHDLSFQIEKVGRKSISELLCEGKNKVDFLKKGLSFRDELHQIQKPLTEAFSAFF